MVYYWEKLEIVNGKIRKYVISYHSWEAGHHPNTPDGEKVQIGEMISRHSDWSLMYLGLAKIRGEMRPGTLRYLTRNVLNFLNIV